MKLRTLAMTALICITVTLNTMAAFTPPTETQIAAAAADPATLSSLLHGASLEQSAHIMKAVIARIVMLNLGETAMSQHLTQATSEAMGAIPAQAHIAFSAMLGNEMGTSFAIRNQPLAVSVVQGALVTSAGNSGGAAVAQAFGDAFSAASKGFRGSGSTTESDNAQPPAASLYPGQE